MTFIMIDDDGNHDDVFSRTPIAAATDNQQAYVAGIAFSFALLSVTLEIIPATWNASIYWKKYDYTYICIDIFRLGNIYVCIFYQCDDLEAM